MRKTLFLADNHSLMLEGLTRILAEEYEIVNMRPHTHHLSCQPLRGGLKHCPFV
jgi:hypothetical protein